MFESMSGLLFDDRLDEGVDLPIDALVESDLLSADPAVSEPMTRDVSNLANIAPSGGFALELDWASEHPDSLSAAQLVDAAVGFERIVAWATARQQAVLAAFGRRPDDGSIRPATSATSAADRRAWAADETGLALTLSSVAAAVRMAQAGRFDGVLRPTRDLLAEGKICPARARLIADMLAEHDDDVAAAVQARVLPSAPEQTAGQLRAALSRAITAVVPDPEQRHQKARRERRVDLWPGQDGMATLSASLTAPEATASFEWITRLARGLPVAPGTRERGSMDRRRADVLVGLLTGRLVATTSADTDEAAGNDTTSDPSSLAAPVSAHRPLIHITVPVTSLIGVDNEPGELAGYGPIPAPLARQIANGPDSVWRRLLTDPVSGTLLDYGRTIYRPPSPLAGFVRARDAHCRFPGCRRPAAACELDHVQPWSHDGTTSEDNLCALCARHHDLKERLGWRVVLHPDRRMEWITPTGHHYWSSPLDHRPPRHASPSIDPVRPPPRQAFPALWSVDPPDPGDLPPF